jgi:hypothetical protein
MVDKAENGSPGANQDKLEMQGESLIGNEIGGDNASDKENQPKYVGKNAHTLNLSKEMSFRLD